VFGTRYRIIDLLGSGGMGAVYRAWDAELAITVAIKVIRPEVAADPVAAADIERRFKRELLLAREVTHPNVVRIHDLGEIGGIKYITMAYVDGIDLATLITMEGKIAPARALRIARCVVSGLVAAHAANVVHRDLKPANVMVDGDDNALIMDFGIARSTADPVARTAPSARQPRTAVLRRPLSKYTDAATAIGSIVGTVEYMAPEQAQGLDVDQRADVYACGLIVYDMLTGYRRGDQAASAFRELQARMERPLPSVASLEPEVPQALDRLVSRCIDPDREQRFQSTAEVAAELDRLDENGEPIPIKRVVGMRLVAAIVTLLLSLSIASWWYARLSIPPTQHEPVSVLIADFDNRAADPVFDGSLEQALGLSMEAASFITAVKREDARNVAAQIRPGSRLDAELARLVSMREGIKVVLAGSIEPKGSGYTVTVTALDPTNGNTLNTAAASAADNSKVLQAVGSVASKLRGALGDSTPDAEKRAAAETVTASSLEAFADYSKAQDLFYGGRDVDAIGYYKRAIEKDPQFGRAYSGLAISTGNLGRKGEAEEFWREALVRLDRMTEREKYRTLGMYLMNVSQNYDKAIENYETLIKLYPNDNAGHINLALAYFYTRQFGKAVEAGRHAIDASSGSRLSRVNYALYAMYAGDFKAAAKESAAILEKDATLFRAYLPLAMASLAARDVAGAQAAYERMAKTGAAGASFANLGLGDLALYEGRFSDAESILRPGIADDERNKNKEGLAAKYVALAEAHLGQGQSGRAADAARRAIAIFGKDAGAALPARILLQLGREVDAKRVADDLGQQLQPGSRAYGKMLAGELLLRQNRPVDAIETLVASTKLADLWLARFDLGVAYVETGHFAEAIAEFEACQKRRGEATAVLLDDLPSFHHLATLPYWLARAQQGLGLKPAALENYKAYLAIRSNARRDPLAADAGKRIAAL
jgi:eukaryotic-like serine/threonine-protein kinase